MLVVQAFPFSRISTTCSKLALSGQQRSGYREHLQGYRSINNGLFADTAGLDVVANDVEEEEEEDEWEYEEFEILVNEDFYGSEWKVGTLLKDKNKIDETWVRFLQDGDQAIWGDGAKGKWKLDVPNQFLTVSKETIGGWGGKKVWACQLDDYYYLEGTVRGWAPWAAANVFAQWQARRLGVEKDEAGIAPWFERENEETEEEVDESGEEENVEGESDERDRKSVV